MLFEYLNDSFKKPTQQKCTIYIQAILKYTGHMVIHSTLSQPLHYFTSHMWQFKAADSTALVNTYQPCPDLTDPVRVETFNQPGTETGTETGSVRLSDEEASFDFLFFTGSVADVLLLRAVFVGAGACLGVRFFL